MNVSALVIDFSRVLIFANADVPSLNHYHAKLAEAEPGYRVLEHFKLNLELLEYLRIFNSRWPVILFTDGKLHVLPEIAPQLEGIFKRIITAEEMGYKKSESDAYLTLAYRIGRTPQEILSIDDQPRNIEAATAAGCATHQYKGNLELIKFLDAATAPLT